MSLRTLAIVTLLSSSVVYSATITLYNPGVLGASDAGPTQTPSVVVSAIDVLPGNITEYAAGQLVTVSTQVGSGTATSFSPVVTISGNTFQEGANFFGATFNQLIETASVDDNGHTVTATITNAVTQGCTMTAPTASETILQCAQIQVVNGTDSTTVIYTATASPFHTLTESTPPPTASVTTGVLFPSGIPTSAANTGNGNTSAALQSTPYRPILLILAICLGLFTF